LGVGEPQYNRRRLKQTDVDTVRMGLLEANRMFCQHNQTAIRGYCEVYATYPLQTNRIPRYLLQQQRLHHRRHQIIYALKSALYLTLYRTEETK